MDAKQERGLHIAAVCKIEKNRLGWKVPSQSGNGTYIVNLDHGKPFCTCPDFEKRQQPCKHIHAVEYVIQRETKPDGSTAYTQTIKMTCTQDWPAYNEAQTHEAERFTELLHELCRGIIQLGLGSVNWRHYGILPKVIHLKGQLVPTIKVPDNKAEIEQAAPRPKQKEI